MMKLTHLIAASAAVVVAGQIIAAQPASEFQVNEKQRPKLFKQFGAVANVPDGFAQDKWGNLYVAAPNLNNPAYAGVIMRYCKKAEKWSVFFAGLRHPETGKGIPMGMEFAENGDLYYADNQYFTDKNYKSRIIRVVTDKTTGEALYAEPVVTNIKLANAVRCRGNAVYFTDTFFDIKDKNLGGVYRVPFSAFDKSAVKLENKENAEKDPYCIGITSCTPNHRGDIAATDGMCFDKAGNIYTGNFGDGHFYTLKIKDDGNYEKPKTLIYDTKQLPCVDGVNYWPKKNWVFIADSERNAVCYWDIDAKKLGVLWINDDTDGADGLLDQPCECIVWDGKLIVSNFDVSFPGLKNKENDKIHSLSVIKLP